MAAPAARRQASRVVEIPAPVRSFTDPVGLSRPYLVDMGPNSVGRAVAKFALSGLVVVALLGFVAVFLFQRLGRSEAIDDARNLTRLAGVGIVEPALTPTLDIARLDRIVHARVLNGTVVRVKVWRPDGTIIYSDQHRLIGARYGLGEEEHAAFRTGAVNAEISDLSRPENRFERKDKKLLEVYLPVHATNGKPLLYEEYLRYSSVSANARRIWRDFAPAVIAALVLLELVQVPLAWSLARRLRDRQREREQLLQQAVEASDVERRRIAADLHDGLVQELAGVSYELAAAGQERAASALRASVRQLRALLVQIYPPSLQQAGLEAALADLLAPAASRGLHTELEVDTPRLSPSTEELLFRAAQEALRNVVAHSGASSVKVKVTRNNGRVELSVVDDGRGFDAAEAARRRGEGHVGLTLLGSLAEEAGGVLEVERAGERGTMVRVEVPST
jgi:two-component system, NarL family, sensor kinase